MFRHSLLETKQPSRCQRCGGQLIRSYDEISCLQCGAPHTEEGELVTHYTQDLRFQFDTRKSIPGNFSRGKRPRREHR